MLHVYVILTISGSRPYDSRPNKVVKFCILEVSNGNISKKRVARSTSCRLTLDRPIGSLVTADRMDLKHHSTRNMGQSPT